MACPISKGSKNQIAKWIIGQLPQADIFVDLFFGGGAVTHAGLLYSICMDRKDCFKFCNRKRNKIKRKIFTNKKTWNKLDDEQKQLSNMNFAEQISLFDFITESGD